MQPRSLHSELFWILDCGMQAYFILDSAVTTWSRVLRIRSARRGCLNRIKVCICTIVQLWLHFNWSSWGEGYLRSENVVQVPGLAAILLSIDTRGLSPNTRPRTQIVVIAEAVHRWLPEDIPASDPSIDSLQINLASEQSPRCDNDRNLYRGIIRDRCDAYQLVLYTIIRIEMQSMRMMKRT